jgi:hypothetical protein
LSGGEPDSKAGIPALRRTEPRIDRLYSTIRNFIISSSAGGDAFYVGAVGWFDDGERSG